MSNMGLLGKKKKAKEDINLSKGELSDIVEFMDSVKNSISDLDKRMDAHSTSIASINELDYARAIGYREAMKDMMKLRGEK